MAGGPRGESALVASHPAGPSSCDAPFVVQAGLVLPFALQSEIRSRRRCPAGPDWGRRSAIRQPPTPGPVHLKTLDIIEEPFAL